MPPQKLLLARRGSVSDDFTHCRRRADAGLALLPSSHGNDPEVYFTSIGNGVGNEDGAARSNDNERCDGNRKDEDEEGDAEHATAAAAALLVEEEAKFKWEENATTVETLLCAAHTAVRMRINVEKGGSAEQAMVCG